MPNAHDERLSQIVKDVAYYKEVIASVGVGGQPPTIYAAKYVADMEVVLQLVAPGPATAPTPPVKSPLDRALADDQAGRVERKPRKS